MTPTQALIVNAHDWLAHATAKEPGWGNQPAVPIALVGALIYALEDALSSVSPPDEGHMAKIARDERLRYSQCHLDAVTKPLHAEIERLTAAVSPQGWQDELYRVTAERDRLLLLCEAKLPTLTALRDIECGLRDYLFNGAKRLEELHEKARQLLPADNSDVPSFGEFRGLLLIGDDEDPALPSPPRVAAAPEEK